MTTILIIDDDPADIRVVQITLRQTSQDFNLLCANTLSEGLDALKQGHIDLVLLDLGLPDSTGLDTITPVTNAFSEMPIVVLTGLSSEEAGLEALRRGASDYLLKDSITPETLRRTIRYALERKKLELELIFLASHDPLTGTLNRRTFEEIVNRAIARARRGCRSSLILFDVDRFKIVNDTLGHSAGDNLLTRIVHIIQAHLRTEDALARVGGDEFVALLEATPRADARTIAERIRAAVADSAMETVPVIHPTLSVGVVEIDGLLDYQALFSHADGCLYHAKTLGRNRVVDFCPLNAFNHDHPVSPASSPLL